MACKPFAPVGRRISALFSVTRLASYDRAVSNSGIFLNARNIWHEQRLSQQYWIMLSQTHFLMIYAKPRPVSRIRYTYMVRPVTHLPETIDFWSS